MRNPLQTITNALLILSLLIGAAAQAFAAGKVAGRLYDPGGSGWKEFFAWHYMHGNDYGSGDYTDMGGYWQNSAVPAGLYTYGLSRMYDLGPVIKPNVLVEDGKTTRIAMIWPADYWVAPNRNLASEPHKSFAQCWVSRGGSILQAAFHLVQEQNERPTITCSIHENGPDGKQIGPSSDGNWKHGEVKTTHGKTYCLVMKSDSPFRVYLGDEQFIQGDAYFDGQRQEKTVISGQMKFDRDGLITQRFAWPGHGGEYSGACRRTIGQTFKAKGNGLAMFDFTFMVGGGRQSGLGSTLRVLEGGPDGKQVGLTRQIKHMWDGHLRNHIWARGECPLEAGKTYYVEITAENGPFQVIRVKDDLADGTMYMDGKPLPEWDIDTCLMEYEDDHSPPPPVKEATIDPAGNAYQISFDVPQDMDCSMVDIRRGEGDADPEKTKPITRMHVSADQTYIYVDRTVKTGRKYTYSLTVLDESENQSPPTLLVAEPLSADAESNLLVNGNFIARAQGGGGIAPGWEALFVNGGAASFMGMPREGKPGGSIWFWNKYSTYDCVFYQEVPVQKGKSYRLNAYAKVGEPFKNGNVNQMSFLGIDPLGRLEPMADEVAWSAPHIIPGEWQEQTVRTTAKSDRITVYLRARAMYGGFGMETAFTEARLTEIATPSAVKAEALESSTASRETAVAGEMIVNWAHDWGDFNEAVERSQYQFPWNWYEHNDQGVAYVRDVNAAYHTVGVSRAFGLGPTVQPNVWVDGERPTTVTIDYHFDYFAKPSTQTVDAKEIAQPFIAKGVSLIKAGFLFEEPFPKRSVRYEVREGRPDGRQIGPTSNAMDDAIGSLGSWVHGDIPLKAGQLYYLVCRLLDGNAKPFLAETAKEADLIYVDGKPRTGLAMAGFVQSDPPGLITTLTSPASMKDKEQAGQYVQSFVAKGTSLALVDFVPWFENELPDGTKTDEFDIRVGFRSPAQGDVHTHRMVKCKSGHVSQVVFAPGEIPLTPGNSYVIQLNNPAGRPFQINWTWNVYGPGCFWRGDKPLDHLDADMNILEYAPTDESPDAPELQCLSGNGFSRLEYTAPNAAGISKIQIRYRDGWFRPEVLPKLQDKLLAEIDVTPGQRGVLHDNGLASNQRRSYAAYTLDRLGNASEAEKEGSYVGYGPMLPASHSIANSDFSVMGAHGGPPAWWNYRVLAGSIRFDDKAGAVSWRSSEESDAAVYQTISLVPGRTYRLETKATGSQAASVGIDPLNGFDPRHAGIVWSNEGTTSLIFKATKPSGTLFLRGVGTGEISFAPIELTDITMH